MRACVRLAAVLCLLGLGLAGASAAAERPRVGVALSGGAAKGLAHIGVLKVLEKTGMPIDFVSGVSMGSVVGGMYAAGYTAAQIESITTAIDWAELFSDRTARRMLPMENKPLDSRDIISFPMNGFVPRMPSGLIEGKNVVRLFSRLSLPRQQSADFRELPIPFVTVAADLMTGEAVVLESGFLAEAMRASMAIPSVFSPVRIGGRLLVDGGLVRNLPAVDARNLGADIVIGVDVGKREYTEEELTSFIAVSNQTMNLILGEALVEQQRLCDILIQPDLEGVSLSAYSDAPRIIRRGEEAALAILPRLQALADSLNALSAGAPSPRDEAPAPLEEVSVVDLEIGGLSDVPRSVVEREFLVVRRGGAVPVGRVEASIDKIRGSGLFEGVNSRFEGIEKDIRGERLVLGLREKKGNELGVGLRYDTRRNASVLFDTTFRNVMFGGATLAFDAVLRDEFDVGARYLVPLGLIRSLGFKARANAAKAYLNLYDGDERAAAYGAFYYFGEAAFGTLFSTRVSVSAGVRGEYADQRLEGGREELATRRDTLFPFYGLITIDTLDRKVYARRGVFIQASAETADEKIGSDATFSRFYFDGRAIVPVGRKMSILGSVYVGSSTGDDLPPAYYYFLGGVDEKVTLLGKPASFYGLDHQDRSGRHIQTAQLGAQWEAGKEIYVVLVWNGGNTFDEWSSDVASNRYINGAGLTLGVDSIAGPLEATVMTSEKHDFLFYFSAGYKF
jgi:NTE family protein